MGIPAGAAAEVAGAVERQHAGVVERRSKEGGSGMRDVVLHQNDLGVGKSRSELEMDLRLRPGGKGPDDGNAVQVGGRRAGHLETGLDGFGRKLAGLVCPGNLFLFHGGCQSTLAQDGARGVVQQPSKSENNHGLLS